MTLPPPSSAGLQSRHRENIAVGCTHALGCLPQQRIAA
jgi:hypothetical protein